MARASSTKSLPIGTQVVALTPGQGPKDDEVCPQGSHGSRCWPRKKHFGFLSDSIVTFSRACLAIRRKHFQHDSAQDGRKQSTQPNFHNYIIYRCVVGSRAFGLDESSSDFDRRGIFLPPASFHGSLFGLPEQIENHETQECYWEIEKLLLSALKANPNILECLYTPSLEPATLLAQELLSVRYVMSQFKKLSGDLRNKGSIGWKHAMYLIGLLVSGITILREGFVPLRIEEPPGCN